MLKPTRTISSLLRDPETLRSAWDAARKETIARHKAAGIPLVVMLDGKVTHITAEELEQLDAEKPEQTDRDPASPGE